MKPQVSGVHWREEQWLTGLLSTRSLRVPHLRVHEGTKSTEESETKNKPQVADLGFLMEGVTRIELALSAWEATALAEPDSL